MKPALLGLIFSCTSIKYLKLQEIETDSKLPITMLTRGKCLLSFSANKLLVTCEGSRLQVQYIHKLLKFFQKIMKRI